MCKIRFGILGIMMVLMTGCLTVDEEISISDKGVGTYLIQMDMSQLMQMMQVYAGEDELAKNGLDRVVDTTLSLGNMIDTSSRVTEQQKRLVRDGTMKVQMNMKENLFKANIHFPYHSFSDLQRLMSGEGTAGLTGAFQNTLTAHDSTQTMGSADEQALMQLNRVFDISVTKSSISRKLNEEKYRELMARPEIAQAKEVGQAGMPISYTTVIHLPRPASKWEGAYLKVSDDKKTVTITYNLFDLFETPEKFAYSFTY